MPNRLVNATSPYLLQHANNPVDWNEWGSEALERAKREDKPILLSIGYAACHWCHVMERESFENHDTARLMNLWFVPVKVDREERPDLDAIYMDAVQAMTGRGGWPMTVFCTPDGKPFYGGTYYPPEDRHGMPGFPRVLTAINEAWGAQRDDLLKQARALTEHISRRVDPHKTEHDLTDMTLRAAVASLRETFDTEWGGFGSAPKFPQPMIVDFLLRMHLRGEPDALGMATTTLDRMAQGGMFDHVGGGFARYSTDREWLVPHFEKMLYDNAQLLKLYTRAWLVTGSTLYRDVAEQTADFLLREMRHDRGGFFSSQDADSEGVEGKFYVWSEDEFKRVAGDDADVSAAWFSVTTQGNWEHTNVLWTPREAEALGLDERTLRPTIERVRTKLFDERARRIHPETDDKVLASWNGLAISGLCEAGRVFDRDDYIAAARDSANFVLEQMQIDGRLHRSWREGRTSGPGFLDDYSMMAGACIDLYETTFEESWFGHARRLADDAIRLFADEAGGFWDTGSDAESLVARPRDFFDNAVPAGNSVMCETLLRLEALSGDHTLGFKVEPVLKLLQPAMASSPGGFGYLLGALDLYLERAKEIAIVGDLDAAGPLIRTAWRRWHNRALAAGAADSGVALLADRTPIDGKPAAYVCEGFVCLNPVTDAESLAKQLAL